MKKKRLSFIIKIVETLNFARIGVSKIQSSDTVKYIKERIATPVISLKRILHAESGLQVL